MSTTELISVCKQVGIEPSHTNLVCLRRMIEISGEADVILLACELKETLNEIRD